MNKILRIHETNRFPKKIAGFPPQKNAPHPWLLHETVDFRHGIGMAILAVQSYTWVVYGKSMGNNYPQCRISANRQNNFERSTSSS